MSVLIEAVCLVVPRRLLDLHYSGGMEGFLSELARPSSESRHVCADRHVVSVSFSSLEAADRTAGELAASGMIESRDGSYADFAIIDQNEGPLRECSWAYWSREVEGYSCAWLSDADRGELAVPAGWVVAQSRRFVRSDSLTHADSLQLSVENGVETWLDLRTGRILERGRSRSWKD